MEEASFAKSRDCSLPLSDSATHDALLTSVLQTQHFTALSRESRRNILIRRPVVATTSRLSSLAQICACLPRYGRGMFYSGLLNRFSVETA